MITSTISNPWSSDSLYAKALLYIEQMESKSAEDWQYGLMSALCLELLARAALSSISPVLLADSKNWRNITYALGHAPTAKKFSPVSISTREVFARINELFPEFRDEIVSFCAKHIERRNAELHSGEVVFGLSGTAEWLPKFYQACQLLLKILEKSIEDFVSDSDQAKALIDSLADAAAKAVNQEIKAHALVWKNKTEDERNTLKMQSTAWASRHSGHRVSCPSCESPSLLQGSPNGPVSTKIDGDEIIQKQTLLPASFECLACGLKILGFSKLSVCGLGDPFSEKSIYSAAEFFDLYTEEDIDEARYEIPDFEPDFNE